MGLLNKKNLIILIVVVALLIAGKMFFFKSDSKLQSQSGSTSVSESDKPSIVSTKPDPLNEAIIGANDTIEISFNRPLENVGEFKVRMEPEIDFKKELSPDRKTAKIVPAVPFELGSTYTIFIGGDTKFDGVGAWNEEKVFHIRTIRYRGV